MQLAVPYPYSVCRSHKMAISINKTLIILWMLMFTLKSFTAIRWVLVFKKKTILDSCILVSIIELQKQRVSHANGQKQCPSLLNLVINITPSHDDQYGQITRPFYYTHHTVNSIYKRGSLVGINTVISYSC